MDPNDQSGANMSVFQAGKNNLILSSSNFLCKVSAGKVSDFSDYEKISNNIFVFDLGNFIHISVPPVKVNMDQYGIFWILWDSYSINTGEVGFSAKTSANLAHVTF